MLALEDLLQQMVHERKWGSTGVAVTAAATSA